MRRHLLHTARIPSSLQRTRGRNLANAAVTAPAGSSCVTRFAVIGGGFAGVASVWHLLDKFSHCEVDLIEAHDLGAGGSGAAAGLLHPFNPTGKLLWRGNEACRDALMLLQEAEVAAKTDTGNRHSIAWQNGMLRPATTLKELDNFCMNDHDLLQPSINPHDGGALGMRATYIRTREAAKILPGLQSFLPDEGDVSRREVLHIPQGVTLRPFAYLHKLWNACELKAKHSGSVVTYRKELVTSLASLEQQRGPYDAVVVAAGAAVGCIQEIGATLPLKLCQGYSVDFEGPESSSPDDTTQGQTPVLPSILGSVYLAMQTTNQAVVGATREHGWTPEQALSECGRDVGDSRTEPNAEAAKQLLLDSVSAKWPPIKSFRVKKVRSGVRAMPPRTDNGAVPLVGQLPVSSHTQGNNWWVIAGLGARGLVYHAWLARLVVEAIHDKNEQGIPSELTAWKTVKVKRSRRRRLKLGESEGLE